MNPAGIASCDVELSLTGVSDKVVGEVIARLETLGAPKGSMLIVEASGCEISFLKLARSRARSQRNGIARRGL
jgi:hypothetical protein